MSRNSTPVGAQAVDRAQDVVGGQRDVLAAGAVVELEVLVDLRLLLRDGRLVERELHPVVAVGDHLAHQRGVVGGDVVADELGHVREAHDPVVEVDPLVHPAELDVADAVVEGLEQPLRVRRPAGPRWCRGRRSRAGTGRCSGCRSTSVCRVSPYVAIAASRTVPCSSDYVVRLDQDGRRPRRGRARCTCRRRAPRARGRRRRRRACGGARAAGCPGRPPPVMTNRAPPDSST